MEKRQKHFPFSPYFIRLIIIAISVACIYLLIRSLINNFLTTIFLIYIGIALIDIISGLSAFYQFTKGKTQRGMDDIAILPLSHLKFIGKIHVSIVLISTTSAAALSWPYYRLFMKSSFPSSAHTAKGSIGIDTAAFVESKVLEYREAFTSIFILMFAFIYSLIIHPEEELVFYAFIAVLIPILKMLSFALGFIDLPTRFRVSASHPYLAFLVLAFIYIIILSTGFTAIQAWVVAKNVRIEAIISIVVDLCTLQSVRTIPSNWPLSTSNVLFIVSALLLYYVVIRSTWNWKDFKKRDDDWARIAKAKLIRGEHIIALDYLEKIRKPGIKDFLAKASALFCANRYADGMNEITKVQVLLNDRRSDQHNLALISAAMYNAPSYVFKTIIDNWLDTDPSPNQLISGLLFYTANYDLTEDDIDELLHDKRLDTYPILKATLLLTYRNISEAYAYFEAANPINILERIYLTFYLLLNELDQIETREEERAYVHIWFNNHFPYIHDETLTFDGWDLIAVLPMITAIREYLEYLDSHYVERIMNLEVALRKRLEEESTSGALFYATEIFKRDEKYTDIRFGSTE